MAREFRYVDRTVSPTRWEKVDACRMQHEREDQQEHNTAGALSELSDEQLVGLVLSSSTLSPQQVQNIRAPSNGSDVLPARHGDNTKMQPQSQPRPVLAHSLAGVRHFYPVSGF